MFIGLHVSVAPAVEDNSSAESATTGSHLIGLDTTDLLPITIYTREDILRSGESNAADFIRNLPFNSFGSFRPQSGNSAQSNSVVSLKGIGAIRTLVLIDGRRLGMSPTIGDTEDLNVLPMGAIERIEVLRDGASAIYGADALAGVVNVITRTEFQGVELMIGGAEVSLPSEGGEREEGSVVFGTHNERSSLLAGVSWNDREIILRRDLPWTRPEFSIYGNNYTTMYSGYDNFDLRDIPGGCNYPGTGYTFSQHNDICYYNYNLHAADEASIENKSFFANAAHQISDDWRLTGGFAFRQTESYGQFAPTPGTSALLGTPLSINSPNNPTNPNSPIYDPNSGLNPQVVNWWHRFDALGNRETTVQNQQQDFKLELDGDWAGIDWQFGIRHLDYRSSDVGKNYVLRSAAEQMIESGMYDLSNPYAAPENVLNAIRTTIYREGKFDIDEYYGSAQFNWLELPGGSISTVVGYEYRKEKYADQYDPQSEAGQILGSAGNSAGANRSVSSVFIESYVPLFNQFSIKAAARYDNFSSDLDVISPQISLHYQPLNNLNLQFGYSKNTNPPGMNILSQKPTYSVLTVRDPSSCIAQGYDPGCSVPIQNISYANPRLQEETAEHRFLGAGFALAEWLDIQLNVYDLSISNRIRSFTSNDLVIIELNGGIVPVGLGCERRPNGDIVRCFSGYGNRGRIDQSGAELDVSVHFDLFGGTMQNQLQLGYVHEFSLDGNRDLVGDPGLPQMRATLNNHYRWQNFEINYNIHGIDKQHRDSFSTAVGSWVTHDIQLIYHAPWDGAFTFGAQNLTKKEPPLGQGAISNRDYDMNLYHGFGRIVYARYTQSF